MLKKSHRKWMRIAGVSGAVVIVLLVALHIWFSYNAKYILENAVYSESNGQLVLKVKRFSFNYLTNHVVVKTALLQSTDSTTQTDSYKVQFGRLDLQINSFWPLLFKRQLFIDSIKLYNPQFSIYHWREDSSTENNNNDVSVPREMGKLYKSMLNGLNTFGIQRILISSGKFILVNKTNPSSKPVVISNIFFNLIKNGADSVSSENAPQNQMLDLVTFNQNITFPDGRHHLAFKNFKLQLFKKRIDLDSCTVTAESSDSAKSRYTIFFDKLSLINVDFDALYRYNLIKADSVYCLQPHFHIQLARYNNTEKQKDTNALYPKKLLHDLSGNLELGYVGVKKAGIQINVTGSKTRTFFNSNQDNFEIRGLRVNADSATPVVVNRFDMVVRDYRLYNKDSSSIFSFDSIRVVDNKITLSNFSVLTSSSPNVVRSYRDFKIPYFQLVGLNWYDLIFEQNLNAQEAILYNPVLYYRAKPKAGGRKQLGVFHALQVLDSLMTLRRIGVINGQVNMQLNPYTSFTLQNASVILNSNDLLESKNVTGIKESVELLEFSKGEFHIKDMTVKLNNVNYTGKNLMHIQEITANNKSNTLNATANDVWLNNLLLNEAAATITLKGINWSNGNITINGLSEAGGSKSGSNTARLNIQNISGKNTTFSFNSDKLKLHTYFNAISASRIEKGAHSPLMVDNLQVNGEQLSLSNPTLQASVNQYTIKDQAPSVFTSVHIQKEAPSDTLLVNVPKVEMVADVNSFFQKNNYIPSLQLQQPDIQISKTATVDSAKGKSGAVSLRIGSIIVKEPSVQLTLSRNDSVSHILLPSSSNGQLKLDGVKINNHKLTIEQLRLNNNSLTYTKPTGQVLGVNEGSVHVQLSDIKLNTTNLKPVWSATVQSIAVDSLNAFTVGKNKNKLAISSGALGNLELSSEYVGNFGKLLKNNLAIWLRTKNGQYIDSATTVRWFNSNYDAAKKRVTLDSFIYHPTLSLDSVMAHSAYQTDYITFATGSIAVTDFNLDQYSRDSALQAGTIAITQPHFTVYRDKRLPYKPGAVKPLPTAMIRQLHFPVHIKKVELENGFLSYTEVSEKTSAAGTVTLNNLDATISHIKNQNLEEDDSLTLKLDAYLMDSAKFRLRVHESYLDSLSTFRMTLRMTPTSLNFLNSVMVPLSNVKIVSGKIDSLQLRAIAQDYFAWGEMEMYYHNLKIQLVKDGNPNKTTFLTRTLSFLANALIIHKNNNGRKGLVFFKRLRNRSFFNYITKITFSGMATNIGVKSNKKYIRKYRKSLNKQQLPPLNFEFY